MDGGSLGIGAAIGAGGLITLALLVFAAQHCRHW